MATNIHLLQMQQAFGIRTKAQKFLDTLPAPFTNNEAKELTWIESIACYKNTFIVWSGQLIFSIVSAASTFFANIMVNFQFAVNDLKEREAQFVEQNSLFKKKGIHTCKFKRVVYSVLKKYSRHFIKRQ